MRKLLIDTDVLIDFSKGKSELLKKLLALSLQSKIGLYITPVNIAEYLNDFFLVKNNDMLPEALSYLENFKVQAVEKKAGVLAGQYLREVKTEYIGDALVAGCCLANGLELVTRNRRHFKKIEGLNFY
jgi:predicted nucleic acid-binding protein